jgi:hypothetical protein
MEGGALYMTSFDIIFYLLNLLLDEKDKNNEHNEE